MRFAVAGGMRIWIFLGLLVSLCGCRTRLSDENIPTGRVELPDAGAAFCGSKSGQACAAGFFCAEGCQNFDQGGTCRARPTECPHYTVAEPVCGCDLHTYDNPCELAKAGVSLASKGPCVTPAFTFPCGSQLCGAGQYCYSFGGGDSDGLSCKDAPPACGPRPTCDCVAPNAPSYVCTTRPDGSILVDGCPACD